jgi:hypothetical protein
VLFMSAQDANLNVGRILVRVRRGGQAEAISTVIDSYREATRNLADVRKHPERWRS